jgi:hypothetical protein
MDRVETDNGPETDNEPETDNGPETDNEATKWSEKRSSALGGRNSAWR